MAPPTSLVFLGAINWDTTIFVERLPRPGQEVKVVRVDEGPGGKGANAAVAAGRILGRDRVALIGALGDDGHEPQLRKGIRSEGVVTEGVVVVRGARSGRAYVVVDQAGRKEIHTLFGANDLLGAAQVGSPGGAESLASAEAAVVMDVPLPAAAAAAKAAKRHRRKVVYSPGVRGGDDPGLVEEVISLADHLVLDRPELEALTGPGPPAEGVKVLRARRRDLVVVATLGPAGCLVSDRRGLVRVPGVDLRTLGLRAVNSTGAGDAFIAAYAWRAVSGDTPADAARWGNLAGALKAASPKTRGSPSGDELSRTMQALTGVRPRRRDSR